MNRSFDYVKDLPRAVPKDTALGVVQPSSDFREVGDQTSNRVGFP